MLTPRENFKRFFRNEEYEWLPSNEDQRLFVPAVIPSNVARGMVRQQNPYPVEQYGGKDYFGVEWVYDAPNSGSMEVRPLLDDLEDLEEWEEKIVFPDLDSYDWAGCAAENAEYLDTDKLISTTIFSGFFERLISFIGFEDAAIALIDEDYKEYVHALFDKLADFYIDLIARMNKHFGVEYFDFHDDWGTQRATIFSVKTYEEMIMPYIKKVADGAHAMGILMEQHSCGLIEDFIPGLIETGVDTWRGQAINDKKKLVEEYGDQFCFGVELRPRPGATNEEVREMAEKMKADYAGKKIWLFMGRGVTPEQKAIACKVMAGE